MAIQIQFRRGTAAEWTSNNPILAEGEMGNETDTGKFKVGDGVRAWNILPYSSGPVGPQGPIGLTGPQGPQGVKGDQGDQGETGPQGVTGDTGAQGIQGIQGEVGPQGPIGLTGATGLKGDTGDQGPQGIQGVKGDTGDQGIQGIQGIQGEVGPQGPIGDTGPQGIQGIQGEVGPQGLIGLTGPQGEQGIQGIQGIQGETGEGVPAGGAAGQVLGKATGTDFDTAWLTPAASLESLTDVVITSPLDKHVIKFDGANQLWINGVAAGGVTQSATPPADPNKGDGWLDENTGKLYVWWVDANSSQWVQVNSGTVADGALTNRVTAVEARATTLETNVRSVPLGGTGASSFTAGSYIKGNNGSALQAQAGIPAGDITSGTMAYDRFPAGTIVGFNRIRTTARSAYGYSGDVILSDLNIPITPKYANSLLLVQWWVNYESDYNSVFRIYRDNGLIYTSGYQGYNENDGNMWSGVAAIPYDGDVASTPNSQLIQYFVPAGSTNYTTLQLAVRTSGSHSATFYLNRSVNSGGTNAYEIMVSNAVIWEIKQ